MSESDSRRAENEDGGRALGRRPRLGSWRPLAGDRGGRRLIAAAALLHVALAAGLFLAGRAQVAPGLLDRDGIMGSFASDSYLYQQGAVCLLEVLKEEGLRTWAAEDEPVHVKLFSIQFALFAPLFGYSPLSAEPLNLFIYVVILWLVMTLGREVGGGRVGLVAAGVVAVWPTFLLHTTQLLKDPLFIAGGLALVLVVTTWLTRTYSRAGAARVSVLTAASSLLLLLVRVKFGAMVMAAVLFGFALLVVRQLLERRLLYWNMACSLLMLIVTAGALALLYPTDRRLKKLKQYPPAQVGQPKSVAGPGRQFPTVISYASLVPPVGRKPAVSATGLRAAAEWAALAVTSDRYNYNSTSAVSGSSIDRDVEFKDLGDVIRYLPRAFEIGLWAPFPDMWVNTGKLVGSAGRLLSGAETFVIYLCQLLALFAVSRGPRRLASLLMLLLATFGVTMLGLVVSNVGTLYRFRYLFWMLLIILGAKGFEAAVAALRARASAAAERGGESEEAARV